ncbi:MAG: hypothetical protein V1775_08305 [Bacteroidota bacterium]
MKALPEKLFRGVASMSRHHMEAQNFGTCTPKGGDSGDGLMIRHTFGATDNSRFTSWTSTRSVAEGYARSSPNGKGVVLEIDFAGRVAPLVEYRQVGDRFGEDEWLIEGTVRGVRVSSI